MSIKKQDQLEKAVFMQFYHSAPNWTCTAGDLNMVDVMKYMSTRNDRPALCILHAPDKDEADRLVHNARLYASRCLKEEGLFFIKADDTKIFILYKGAQIDE